MKTDRSPRNFAPVLQAVPLSRRERHSAAVRRTLYDTAMRLFAERGFLQTTVEDITNAADVGKGTFFNYFPSKEDLLTSFSDDRLGKIRAALEAAEKGRELIPVILHRLYAGLNAEPGRAPELARSMLLTMLSSETVRQKLRPRFAQGRAMMTKIFRIGQERGEVRRDVAASELAQSFKESYLGSLLCWSLTPSTRLSVTVNRAFEHFWSAAAAEARAERKGKEQ